MLHRILDERSRLPRIFEPFRTLNQLSETNVTTIVVLTLAMPANDNAAHSCSRVWLFFQEMHWPGGIPNVECYSAVLMVR